jgi:ABC-2 type transport system permease protein
MADVGVAVSLGMTVIFLAISLAIVGWIFKTGYKLKT